MEEKTETQVRYDDRRKELTQHVQSSKDIKMDGNVVGKIIIDRKAIFNEEGIRTLMKDLSGQQTKYEQMVKKLKDGLKKVPKMTKELEELEKKIQTINDSNKNKQAASQIEVNESNLKDVRKDIRDIKAAIGSRLKL